MLFIAILAGALTLSGFTLQYAFHVLPCQMCWWQRYAHWAILAAALVGLAAPKRQRPALIAIALAAAAGLAVAAWQFAAQHQWLPWPETCTSTGAALIAATADLLAAMNNTQIVPCDRETFTLLGLSLAGWNIPAMLLVLALAAKALKTPLPSRP